MDPDAGAQNMGLTKLEILKAISSYIFQQQYETSQGNKVISVTTENKALYDKNSMYRATKAINVMYPLKLNE